MSSLHLLAIILVCFLMFIILLPMGELFTETLLH